MRYPGKSRIAKPVLKHCAWRYLGQFQERVSLFSVCRPRWPHDPENPPLKNVLVLYSAAACKTGKVSPRIGEDQAQKQTGGRISQGLDTGEEHSTLPIRTNLRPIRPPPVPSVGRSWDASRTCSCDSPTQPPTTQPQGGPHGPFALQRA